MPRLPAAILLLLVLAASALAAEAPLPRAGEVWREPVTGLEFVWAPGGCFQMGSAGDAGRANERPRHEVCLDGFWLGRTEVTQRAWKAVMGGNPARFPGERRPAESMSWSAAAEFARRLTERSGGKYEFRLPSEAQWEYACRAAGGGGEHPGGEPLRVGWHDANAKNATSEVARLAPNALGLYDMAGNVWEWTADGYDAAAYGAHQRENPLVAGQGLDRVARGGSWRSGADSLRCAYRLNVTAGHSTHDLGLRLLRVR